ncbi:MAG: hypothetical protein LBH87_00600 [Coriobacteriales bacterium]|jgi:hypothetical protein|nr:hypothetical protein [Coriobacteriales bacterium]
MKIDKTNGIMALGAENEGLAKQMSQCDDQIQTLQNINMGDFGLSGEAYRAIEMRLKARISILKAHNLAFDAIFRANAENINKIYALPDSKPGVLDREWCQEKIDEARGNMHYAMDKQDSLRHNLSVTSGTRFMLVGFWQKRIDSEYELINVYQAKIDAANTYDAESKALYDDAGCTVQDILARCSDAAQNCINTGGYDKSDMGLINALDIDRLYIDARSRQKIDAARPYLTEDELAAYILALANDGLVDTEDIYESGIFNETLYSGLAKLPDSCINDAEINNLAKAYDNMWIDNNTEAVERMVELSYLEDPNLLSYSTKNPYPAKVFYQSPILDRIAEAVATNTQKIEKGSVGYYDRLAGADLINALARDEHFVFDVNEVKVDLLAVRAPTNDATFCTLAFGSEMMQGGASYRYLKDASTLVSVGQNIAGNPTIYSLTGDLNTICDMAADLKNKESISPEYTILGVDYKFFATEGISQIIGSIHPIAGPLASLGVDCLSEYVGSKEEGGKGAVITDGSYGKVASNALKYGNLSEFGFGLNITTDCKSDPSALLSPDVNVYASDSAKQRLDDITSVFSQVPLPYGSPTCTDTYGTDQFITDLEQNFVGSVYPYVDVNPNDTSRFLSWTEASASTPLDPVEGSNMPLPKYPDRPPEGWELVYKGETTDADGAVHQGGELVYKDISVSKGNSISNHEFFADKDLSRNYEYVWQYNEKHPDNPVVAP